MKNLTCWSKVCGKCHNQAAVTEHRTEFVVQTKEENNVKNVFLYLKTTNFMGTMALIHADADNLHDEVTSPKKFVVGFCLDYFFKCDLHSGGFVHIRCKCFINENKKKKKKK